MLNDILDSIVRPAAYARFAAENAGRTARYIAFLSLIFVGALGASMKLRLAPLFTETFSWLQTQMPAIHFSNGTVTSSAATPLRVEHPRVKQIAVMIDTARIEPVTLAQMTDAKVMAYLTSNALYMQRGQGRIETIDLTKSKAPRPITIDANSYKDLERAFNWIFYPALLLFFFLVFATALAFSGLVYALIGLLMASIAGGSLKFRALYRIGVHVQTAGSLLYALDAVLPVAVPYARWVSMAMSLTLLWLGVKHCARADAPPVEPAVAA